MSAEDALKLISDSKAKFVDFRFTDTHGKEQHVSVPASVIDGELFEEGKMFDGSSIAGWKGINESDMILMPDPDTAVIDPFMQDTTVLLRCDVIEPATMQGYDRDPRSIAKRAEAYLKSTGAGDSDYEDGNMGLGPGVKGGYFPVPPVDSLQDVRSSMCLAMQDMGLDVEVHHHEVGTAGQGEIGTRFDTLVSKADQTQIYKYCVHNVAHAHGLTATFMPKPLVGDNGSGMHVHQSIFKGGDNTFAGDEYGGLSETALYYIGGIFKHARALNAFTNASTNSYKRLVPGFEAPVMLAYSARNRSASCRIPYVSNPKARRIEVRFPDPTANPYLAFSAMLLAGLDGIQNRIHPGGPMDKDLYDLPPEEEKEIATVAHSLDQALDALDADREFLKVGGVMSDDMIDGYIELKMEQVQRLRMATHPAEFDMYYSV